MAGRTRILLVLGTRPEAIKLAPVYRALAADPGIEPVLCVTGQHRALLDPVLALFGLRPDHDLNLMRTGQTPAAVVGEAVARLTPLVQSLAPAALVVQGDTATALAGAMAGLYAQVPVAHVEAGLRVEGAGAPFPEEAHRRLIARLARWHFAPTPAARAALHAEGVAAAAIHVTGNSGIDALMASARRLAANPALRAACAAAFPGLDAQRPLLLATMHRRENIGARLERICEGLRLIAAGEEAQILAPIHPNPRVAATLRRELDGVPGIHLVAPPGYLEFVWLMRRAALILTDSGGVQEEAPALGRPVLVLRDGTERAEGIAAGVAALVGANPYAIAGAARAVLRDASVRQWMSRPLALYGDGRAAMAVAGILAADLARDAAPRRQRRAAPRRSSLLVAPAAAIAA